MLARLWRLLREAGEGFITDDALSRGAAIAFYSVTSLGPVLFIVVAIGGLAFGAEAARGAVTAQLGGLMGKGSADLVQAALRSAAGQEEGVAASVFGAAALLVTASGVFGEMQAALNVIWKSTPRGTTLSRLVRARMASLGLVAALGFLLVVSLAVSAGLAAFTDVLNAGLPFAAAVLQALNFLMSWLLIAVLFAAIYKVLPDTPIAWRDVVAGALATSLLFNVGKLLIALYLGQSTIASGYGAAGALIVMLLWVYYSSQIFLFGAELTRAYASVHGSRAGDGEIGGGDGIRTHGTG